MRIQHNIMAMGAYRNYTNNLSAMQKNLEKLSSGYKINRAGDDAAGLAISEKMRAQITGLTTAQKNAKDGISLVQTAEGALTEVHDMLNRMVTLATQSANGTYDNETDRVQLQKEMDQLKSEINRIADSSNFNGINLLDGTMDSSSVSGVKYKDVSAKDLEGIFKTSTDKNGIGGKDEVEDGFEIWETEGGAPSTAGFEIDLDGTSVELKAGDKFTLNIGDDTTLEFTAEKDGTYTSSQLAKALADANKTINLKDSTETDREFNVTSDGKKLIFNTNVDDNFKLNTSAKITWAVNPVPKEEEPDPEPTPAAISGTLKASTKPEGLNAKDAVAAQYTSVVNASGLDTLKAGDQIVVDIGGTAKTYTIVDDNIHDVRKDEVLLSKVSSKEELAKFVAGKINESDTDYDVSVSNDGNIVYNAYKPGAVGNAAGQNGPNAAPTTAVTVTFKKDDGTVTDGVPNYVADTSHTFTVNTATQSTAGAEATPADKFIKLSGNNDEALANAAEKAGAADGASLTIQVSGTNKVALYAGDKKIGEADYTSLATKEVTFKDADGNELLKATLVNISATGTAATDTDLGENGFDTGLKYVAPTDGTTTTTPGVSDGADTESLIMALADNADSGTASSINGTGNASLALDGTAAVYSVDLSSKGQSDIDGKTIDDVSITWNTTADALKETMEDFVDTYNGTTGKNYTASWDNDNSKLVLTAKTAGTVASAPQESASTGSATNMTEDTAGAAATKSLNASGLTTSAIKTVADGIDGIATGEVKIAAGTGTYANKLVLQIGDKVVGVSTADIASGTTSYTMKGVDGVQTELGTIGATGVTAGTDITAALGTGINYTAATTGTGGGDNTGGGTTTVKQATIGTLTPGRDAGTAGFTSDTATDGTPVTGASGTDLSDANLATNIGTLKTATLTFGTGDSEVQVALSGITADGTDSAALKTEIEGLINDAFAAKNTTLSGGTANYTKYSDAVVTLDANGISVAFKESAQTYSAASDATAASNTITFTGLTGADVIGDTIKIGDTTYEFVKTGEDVKGTGNTKVEVGESADANTIGAAFATAAGTTKKDASVGSVTNASGVVTVTSQATGASATLSITGKDATQNTPGTPDTPDTPSSNYDTSNNLVTSDVVAAVGGEWKAEATLSDAAKTALKTQFDSLGGGKAEIVLPQAGGVSVDVSKVTEGAKTLGDVANNIMKAAQKAIEEYNKTSTGKKYEVVGVSSDFAGTKWLAGGTNSGIQALADDTGDGFYIQTREKENSGTSENVTKASGTINTGLQNVTDNNDGVSAQLANTVVNFSDITNGWSDGSKITIGDTTYTVARGADSKFKNANNVIDLTDSIKEADLDKVAAQRLTVAAKGNSIFTVGHDGEGNTTLQQRSEVKESTDMSTHEKIASYLGVSTADADSLEKAQPGRGLTLQIGDTAASYNRLTVSIRDMHASSLGLDNISIADPDSAAKAIEKIKAAINNVSDVRGTLGATQNRLDHTINNLSVMTENITDAESTIRDTDVAEEMMTYTKNNILIQSAQAMLAQANQVPQGVLQLLQ